MATARMRSRRHKVASPPTVAFLRPGVWLALIVLLAVLLRAAFLQSYEQRFTHQALGVLPFLSEAGNIAVSIVHGEGFASPFRVATGPTAWMPPLYPLLLAAIMQMFGVYTRASFFAAAGLNIACVSLACVPLYWIAREVAGIRIALGATLLWAIFPNAVLLPVESLWDASLCVLLTLLILWMTLRLAAAPSMRNWILYALLWGLTLMTNPSIAIVLPVLHGWTAWRGDRRKSLNGIAVFAVITVLCCVPWTIRNYRVFHAFVPLRSVFGLPLWLGNNAQSDPRTWGRLHPLVDQDERRQYTEVGELPYMKEKRDLAIAYMLAQPARTMALTGRRVVAWWCGGTPYPIDDFQSVDSFQFRSILLFNVAITLGTIGGIVVLFRQRSPYRWLLAAFPIIYPLTYYATTVVPRYRLPIDPILMLLTAMALSRVRFRRSTPEERADD